MHAMQEQRNDMNRSMPLTNLSAKQLVELAKPNLLTLTLPSVKRMLVSASGDLTTKMLTRMHQIDQASQWLCFKTYSISLQI